MFAVCLRQEICCRTVCFSFLLTLIKLRLPDFQETAENTHTYACFLTKYVLLFDPVRIIRKFERIPSKYV